jgi:glycosyltransferase involved in cell wall biosynthesis
VTGLQISAIICTHNRSDLLRPAVESLYIQSLARDRYEVIVVDNASTDETAALVESLRHVYQSLRYVREPRLGLVHARNTGALAATGDLVAYIDDDARADGSLLECLVHTFETVHPSPAAVGGRVFLDWGGGAPSWVASAFWSLYSHVDHGGEGHPLRDDEYLVGANLALRRAVLLDAGGFAGELVRGRIRYLAGEDTEIVKRLKATGHTVYYAPEAVVWHTVQRHRKTGRWLRSRMFWDGASQPVLDYGRGRSREFYARQAWYEARQAGRFARLWLQSMPRTDSETRLTLALEAIRRAGRVRTDLLLALGPRGLDA